MTVSIMSYKYGHLVAHAIESVLNQTVKADEILVVDDAGSDFYNIVSRYPEVKVIQRAKNMGIVGNFNDILNNHVKTDRVLYLGADNWLHPKTLESLNCKEGDVITYDAYMVGGWDMTDMAQYEQDGYRVWQTNGTPHGSSLYNVDFARSVNGYESSSNEHSEEDSMLFNKMIGAGAKVSYVEQPFLYYRYHKWNYNK